MTEATISTTRSGLWLVATTLVLGACSSSGEQVAGIDGSGSPTPTAIVAQGPIQGFGSIIVNDVHYDIDAAQIRVNGANVTESELRLGQLVTVSGRIDAATGTGAADAVVFEADVQGPVELIDLAMGNLRVLGQDVLLGPTTVVDLDPGRMIEALSVGERVQVSGFANAEGSIAATRVASLEPSDELRVIGTVENLDPANLTFTIHDLTIDYGQTLVIEDFPGGAPTNGDRVLVEAETIDSQGRLVALELERLDRALGGEPGQEAEIEGLITRFASTVDFDVTGTHVTTSAGTRYEGGTVSALALSVKVQVEGRFDASGTIVAEKIEIKDGGSVAEADDD